MTNDIPTDIEGMLARARYSASKRDWDTAINICQKIISFAPESPEVHYLLGEIYQYSGKHMQAVSTYEKVIGIAGCHADALNNLGIVHESTGQHASARHCFTRAVECNPAHVFAHYNLGRLLRTSGELTSAISHLETALRLNPGSSQILLELGSAYKSRGQYREALLHLQKARELAGDNPSVYNLLGNIYQSLGELENAITSYKSAIHLQPDYAEAYNNLGSALLARGDVSAALENYRKAGSIRPDWWGAKSNELLALNYISENPADLYAAHLAWGQAVTESIRPASRTFEQVKNRRIRIGYVSPDFRAHSVAYYMDALFRNHDKSRFEVICFSDTAVPDNTTRDLQSLVTEWHNISGMPDKDLCLLILQSKIDILVDLAGHTANNRLAVFTMQPAPVLTSYLGYPNTTGLTAIQYRISDRWADPPGSSDAQHTEELIRLPDGFLCYTPRNDCPDTSMPPILSSGHITYGSCNVLAKLSDHCIQIWCAILEQDPRARLLLKSAGLQDGYTREFTLKRFLNHGITADRIELLPRIPDFRSHMETYNRIDICLDTLPYNGTTTTCESLWMGVPVITLEGNRHAGRVGTSILRQVGLEMLIARDPDQYVSLATGLAKNIAKLEEFRQSLRGRMALSPLCDGARFTLALEAEYRKLIDNHPRGAQSCNSGRK